MGPMPERSSPSRVRYAAPKPGAPLTAPGRSAGNIDATGGSGGKITKTRQCVAKQRLISDSPAVPRVCGAVRRRSSSRCAISPVSRPAGLPKFKHRGRHYAVPANGCLVTLMRWPQPQRIQIGKSVLAGNPATVASRKILPIGPGRGVFFLDKSLSWMSHPNVETPEAGASRACLCRCSILTR